MDLGFGGIIGWIVIGGLAGWVASMIMKTNQQQGCLMDVIVGIIGAFIGGLVVDLLNIGAGGGLIWSFIVAVLGAVILLAIVKAVRRT